MVAGDVVVVRFWLGVFIMWFLAFVMTKQYQFQWWRTRAVCWGDGGISVEYWWNVGQEDGTEPLPRGGVDSETD
jgi:hypothetical protein